MQQPPHFSPPLHLADLSPPSHLRPPPGCRAAVTPIVAAESAVLRGSQGGRRCPADRSEPRFQTQALKTSLPVLRLWRLLISAVCGWEGG